MLQELTANTGAGLFAIGSTLFFLIIFTGVTWRVLSRKSGSYDHASRLPLDDDPNRVSDRSDTRVESSKGGR